MNNLMTMVKVEYCRDMVKEGDVDHYLCSLFAAPDKRARLFALYAFNQELARTAHRVSEPMLGEIRLEWWRETLDGFAREEVRRHHVAESLYAVQREHSLSAGDLRRLIDVRRLDIGGDALPSVDRAVHYAEEGAGTLAALACAILWSGEGEINAQTRETARAAGCAYGLARLLCGTVKPPLHAEIDRAAVAERARQALDQVRAGLPGVPDAVLPAILPAALCPGYLAEASRAVPSGSRRPLLFKQVKLLRSFLFKKI